MLFMNVRHQNAQLGLNIKPPAIQLTIKDPQLELSTTAVTVEIHQPQAIMEIDQYPCRYDQGIKNLADLNRDFTNDAKQHAKEAISKTVQDSIRLLKIGKEKNIIAHLAAQSEDRSIYRVTLKRKASPQIAFTRQDPQINFQMGRVDTNLNKGSVENNFQWGTVNSYMLRESSIQTWVTENKVDISA